MLFVLFSETSVEGHSFPEVLLFGEGGSICFAFEPSTHIPYSILLNLLCSPGMPVTSGPLASVSQELGLQAFILIYIYALLGKEYRASDLLPKHDPNRSPVLPMNKHTL